MPQLPVLLLKFEDAHHSVQIDAFVLTEVLRLHEPVEMCIRDRAKKEAAESLEALQRERAEFINYRNRTKKDMDRARQQGIIDVLTAMLPGLDDIDRIREHGEMDDSFKAVAAKIDKTFEKFGVEKFGLKGEDFDPTKHEAILHKPDPEASKATVDTVVEAGYRIGDRVTVSYTHLS